MVGVNLCCANMKIDKLKIVSYHSKKNDGDDAYIQHVKVRKFLEISQSA